MPRARFKIYPADAAIATAVMLKGKAIVEDPVALGVATGRLGPRSCEVVKLR